MDHISPVFRRGAENMDEHHEYAILLVYPTGAVVLSLRSSSATCLGVDLARVSNLYDDETGRGAEVCSHTYDPRKLGGTGEGVEIS